MYRRDSQFQGSFEDPRPEKLEHFIFRQGIPGPAINDRRSQVQKEIEPLRFSFGTP
jgi:hypothetical protein